MADLYFLCESESAVLCRFSPGQYLIKQDDPVEYVYYLVEGYCERIEINEFGEEVLFNTKNPNDGLGTLVGLNNLWVPTGVSFSSFVAKDDVLAYRIEASKVKQELQKYPEILDEIITMNLSNYLALRALFKVHHERCTPNMLCELLLNSLVETEQGLFISKKLTNVKASRQLGVHQVTIAKIMSYLQKKEVLQRTSGKIQILDLEQLTEYAEGKKMNYLSKNRWRDS